MKKLSSNEYKYDIIIIGAGIQGLMIAKDIFSEDKKVSLAIIDMKLSGSGGTHYSAAFDLPGGYSTIVKNYSKYSQDYYLKYSKNNDFYKKIDTYVCYSDFNIDEYFNAGAYQADQIGVDELAIGLPSYNKVNKCTSSYYADINALINSIYCELSGNVDFIEGVKILDINGKKNLVKIECSSGKILYSDKCVMCPGPWANNEPFSSYTKELDIKIKKIVAFHVPKSVFSSDSAYFFPDSDAFLLPRADKNYSIYSYTCDTWGVNPNEEIYISKKDIDDARSVFSRYSASIVSEIRSGRAFCDAYNESKAPIVKYVNGSDNIIFAGSANGSGIRLAPGISKEVISMI